MSQASVKDALEQAREHAQALQAKIDANQAKDDVKIHAELEKVSAQAQKLAAGLKVLAENQRADAKLHVQKAQASLEDAAKRAKDALGSAGADLKTKNQAVIARAREGLTHLSQAVAASRAAAAKPSTN
ncbi:MAG: hypothetical protein JO219_09010 [Candidatus Eremiobacteraeota bacterium]|nr:hypothetical protein [Candidatus Eremiobacteraeota bacterium]MBV8364965.1 hypothetical protein [Candidatus Eremiobacteraeota bacterium]